MKRTLVFLLLAVLLLGGCYSRQDMNNAYNRGFSAGETRGEEEGQETGYSAGYDAGYQKGEKAGYRAGYEKGLADGLGDGGGDCPPPVETTPAAPAYVANKNTRKFHLPDCSSVNDIKESNRMDWDGTREALIEQGYVPCKRCNP